MVSGSSAAATLSQVAEIDALPLHPRPRPPAATEESINPGRATAGGGAHATPPPHSLLQGMSAAHGMAMMAEPAVSRYRGFIIYSGL